MTSDQIRELFLRFFEERQHKIIPSSSLIPHGDPTMLLTTAGMVQVKPYFLGLAVAPSSRLASCQKCFRTTDIDSVGDTKHLTFFEMLGNFSVGDYFKREAITWGWEFVTQRLKIAPDKLWVTVFLDDDEAFEYWREIDFPAERIARLGERDNFWGPAGDSGPCGPCSEIHYDFGEEIGCGRPECGPACDCSRFSEVWNLVFMEYNQDRDGQRTKLPKPNIDTGMGLERISAVMQGVASVYDADLFLPIRGEICSLAGKEYGKDSSVDHAIRVIGEHSRGIAFLIADGVLPSNEGRGYVLRRILRRASFFGRRLGIEDIFLGKVCGVVVRKMKHVYPELATNANHIAEIVKIEEEKFLGTLDAGINLAEKIAEESIKQGRDFISGEEVFRLWDTYGFPAELTADIAGTKGLKVDVHGFENAIGKQREKARASHKFAINHVVSVSLEPKFEVDFVGYNQLTVRAKISKISRGNAGSKDKKIAVVLDRTPFYGEMGGQIGDTGKIIGPGGEVRIIGVTRDPAGRAIHHGEIVKGSVSEGDEVEAIVDIDRRLDIARNHTATHLLQAALRQVLGDHVQQRGSLVGPERLRFDFSHLAAISRQQLDEIQYFVNDLILQNIPVTCCDNVPYKQAVEGGAIALFDEKYGDKVRVIEVGQPPVSAELCGGTHVKATGEIGLFLIVSESSIGSGLRRIEALTGRGAYSLLEKRLLALEEIASQVRSSTEEAPRKVEALIAELSAERKRLVALERNLLQNVVESLVKKAENVDGITVLAAKVPDSTLSSLREIGDLLRDRLGSAIIVLGTVCDGRPAFIATVTHDLVGKGFHAGNIVKQVAGVTGGDGGGKATMAQAGGRDKGKIDEALGIVKDLVKKGGQ
ncbi:MAG: alanine--tRNA ligase [Chloroflexi bacterium]|nr:alanine--tRNA ligase [Chloroflexota bacterium]MBM4449613.1 alanine--tRNA ligase [Chloroflexota bacterium]